MLLGGATGGSSSLPGSVGPGNLSGSGLWVIGLGDPVGVVVGVVPTLLLRGSISLNGDSGGVWPEEAEYGMTKIRCCQLLWDQSLCPQENTLCLGQIGGVQVCLRPG